MLARLLLFAFSAFLLNGKDAEFFETRIRPVLAKNCFACHSQTEMGGLRLDTRERAMRGGKSGPSILPGNAAGSLLMDAVQYASKLKMPPKGKLSEREIADLRAWIEEGAIWPEETGKGKQGSFWSFQKVRGQRVPQVRDAAWAATGIDRFVLAKLEAEGVTPAKTADKRTMIRRATFDLTGLPPAPEDVRAFVADESAQAFAKVVDRLLASPRYGERWARHWLDLARYSDGKEGARDDVPYANAFRYRDWVVDSLNRDLPYDEFVKAQIAADLMPGQRHLPALGFQAIGESDNDRVDVTTRVFLGLTVGCAQCHDHKFDPIPTRDYYSVLGVFKSSKVEEFPLVEPAVVEKYNGAKKALAAKQDELKQFLERQTKQVVDILAAQTSQYLLAAWKGSGGEDLDAETLERWKRYLANPEKDHPYFRPWFDVVKRPGVSEAEVQAAAVEMQTAIRKVLDDKKALDDLNYVKVGGMEGLKDAGKVIGTLVDSLPIERFYFWRDLASNPYKVEDLQFAGGVYFYGPKQVERFLDPRWKRYLATLREEVKTLEKAVPAAYPFFHVMKDSDKPANTRIAIRGDAANLGEEAPRRFLSALCDSEPKPFQQGSGRLELANAIAAADNPLTARVMVNRLWKHHFGEGLVRSGSNFGQLGDRPTHPELLDYLAGRLVHSGWSLKAMHREMMLSHVYQLGSEEEPAASAAKDPENRLLWRGNVRERLDAEALRDSILAVSGTLDGAIGGAAEALGDGLRRRTLYATISRSKPDRTMALFDFPDPNASAEQRIVTVGPMQRLFFMNSPFVAGQAKALAARLARDGADDAARIGRAYELLYGREATADEVQLGMEYLGGQAEKWPQYAQVLLSAAEFSAVK
ncbi:MAG TPA: PSD1 and planctomycete cytochrome C domain-containing protein [Bryobacteraceae bacterium]|nr:PSD1 and planctomycete cytochrome C domain-containing protein [Bryobacteraceae bacterium]